jgi:hypothetical protein
MQEGWQSRSNKVKGVGCGKILGRYVHHISMALNNWFLMEFIGISRFSMAAPQIADAEGKEYSRVIQYRFE